MFLPLEIQLSVAEAGLAQVEPALARIDGLLERFAESDHPIVMGSLHEARARIAFAAGRVQEYARSVAMVERWYRPTGTPALIAKWERLVDLKTGASSRQRAVPDAGDPATTTESGPLATVNEPDARTVRVGRTESA
jgi:hypothetical protein